MTRIETFTGGAFLQNGYMAIRSGSTAVIIDPGACAAEMVRLIREEGLDVAAILLTHAHLDHVEGIPLVREVTDAPIHLHALDRVLYDRLPDQAEAFGLSAPSCAQPDGGYEHGERLSFGGGTLEVRFTPGHSPGHVVLYSKEDSAAFVGDVIFQGSIGRTDLPGGDFEQLMISIHEQLLSLPDDTRLLTGHGPETTVGRERRSNPFVLAHARGDFA